jgi:beta-1,4-mannosyl-glycoprotein beta-1,4-N-acetylglucosaminyltransferase
MRIYDCFTYFNEEEIVKLRFEELQFVVDFFVVVEATSTFTGIAKPLFFDDLDIDPYIKKKIIRVKTKFPSEEMSSWDREIFQRNSIVSGLNLASADDMIVISDADEIPNPATLLSLRYDNPDFEAVHLEVSQFFWNYHWQVPQHCNQGARPVVTYKKVLDQSSAQELRARQLPRIPNGGWHFSFFGEEEKIKYKIESFAHTEYDKDEFKNYESIMNRIQKGIDPFDRFPLKYKEIDDSYPKTLQRII